MVLRTANQLVNSGQLMVLKHGPLRILEEKQKRTSHRQLPAVSVPCIRNQGTEAWWARVRWVGG